MEVWNGIWKKILLRNGRFLVWNGNGMEKNCQYGIWKNRLSFHTMPCRQDKLNKIPYKINLPAFFTLSTISCFILSSDVEAEAGSGSGGRS